MLLFKYINIFPNVINLQTSSTLVKYANKLDFEQAGIGMVNTINEKIRKTLRYSINSHSKLLTDVHWANYLHFKIVNMMNHYLYVNQVEDLKINTLQQLDILKYFEKYHYKFHADASPGHHRTLSAILFLNNDYKGGELIFKNSLNNEEMMVKPVPGSIVIWPSNFLYPHMVKPVIEGIRYTVVAWA